MENTKTEHDMDAASRQLVNGFRQGGGDLETDLVVDGLSDSILSRLMRLFGVGKS